jgi:hypothetical protein
MAALLALALILSAAPLSAFDASEIRPGDVVFQALDTPQTNALIAATGSTWTHCGLVAERRGRLVVQEALLRMTETPLEAWIARGGGKVAVTRLKEAALLLTPEALEALDKEFQKLRNQRLRYDFLFQWSDERMYCSELVQKVFERALGVTLAPLRRVGDFDLSDPAVQQLISLRFPGGRVDPDEPAVAPSDLLASPIMVRLDNEGEQAQVGGQTDPGGEAQGEPQDAGQSDPSGEAQGEAQEESQAESQGEAQGQSQGEVKEAAQAEPQS